MTQLWAVLTSKQIPVYTMNTKITKTGSLFQKKQSGAQHRLERAHRKGVPYGWLTLVPKWILGQRTHTCMQVHYL